MSTTSYPSPLRCEGMLSVRQKFPPHPLSKGATDFQKIKPPHGPFFSGLKGGSYLLHILFLFGPSDFGHTPFVKMILVQNFPCVILSLVPAAPDLHKTLSAACVPPAPICYDSWKTASFPLVLSAVRQNPR